MKTLPLLATVAVIALAGIGPAAAEPQGHGAQSQQNQTERAGMPHGGPASDKPYTRDERSGREDMQLDRDRHDTNQERSGRSSIDERRNRDERHDHGTRPDRPGEQWNQRPGRPAFDRPWNRPGWSGHGWGRAGWERWPHRRWDRGARLPRDYWAGSSFWVTNFGRLGLYAPPPYARWVQYGPDALLIDRRNGLIIAVRRDVFR